VIARLKDLGKTFPMIAYATRSQRCECEGDLKILKDIDLK